MRVALSKEAFPKELIELPSVDKLLVDEGAFWAIVGRGFPAQEESLAERQAVLELFLSHPANMFAREMDLLLDKCYRGRLVPPGGCEIDGGGREYTFGTRDTETQADGLRHIDGLYTIVEYPDKPRSYMYTSKLDIYGGEESFTVHIDSNGVLHVLRTEYNKRAFRYDTKDVEDGYIRGEILRRSIEDSLTAAQTVRVRDKTARDEADADARERLTRMITGQRRPYLGHIALDGVLTLG